MRVRTAVEDRDKKLDIIDHIHQDHADELLVMAQSYSPEENIEAAAILDIYNEGVLLELAAEGKAKELFVEFELTGDLEENILYLSYNAAVKQKKSLSLNQKRFFEIVGKQQITRNFTRLLVHSKTGLPEYYPEYAYGFYLKIMKQASSTTPVAKRKGFFRHLFDRVFLWLIKTVSSKNRQRIIEVINKDIRLYTLRKSFKALESSDFLNQGFIDVYTHGDSPGSQWVVSLKEGDVILSCTEIAYKHDHLTQGNAVLIADETAYPAVAGVLENWVNAAPPVVVIVSANDDEQDYFHSGLFPENTEIHRVVCAVDEQGEKVIDVLRSVEHIDAVWGALESDAAKTIRHYLRNQRGLEGKKSHLKGYWKIK